MALLEGLATTESSISSVTFVPDVNQKIGLLRDTSQLVNPYFPDLVNNHYHLHNNVLDHSLLTLMNDDTPSYNDVPSILSLEHDIVENPQKYVEIKSLSSVKVPSDAHYTCDARLGNGLGMDRLWEFYPNSSHKKKYDNYLRQHNGWSDPASCTLIAYVRWIFDSRGQVVGFTIVKICGNGRDYMKVIANGGDVCEHIMKLTFHEINPELTYEDYQTIEAEGFVQDQQLQNPHSGETKFIAGVKANDEQWVNLRDYLKSHDLDFKEVVSSTTDQVPRWEISSFEGFTFGKGGKPCHDVREFSDLSIRYALDTLKTIQEERQKLGFSELKGTKSVSFTYIPNTAFRVLIRMFEMLTEPFTDKDTKRKHNGLCSKEWLKEYLVWNYTQTNRKKNQYLRNLSELNMKGTANIKDFYFFGMITNIVGILKDLDEDRENRIMDSNPVIKRYISKISLEILQDEIRKIIKNR